MHAWDIRLRLNPASRKITPPDDPTDRLAAVDGRPRGAWPLPGGGIVRPQHPVAVASLMDTSREMNKLRNVPAGRRVVGSWTTRIRGGTASARIRRSVSPRGTARVLYAHAIVSLVSGLHPRPEAFLPRGSPKLKREPPSSLPPCSWRDPPHATGFLA